LLNDQGAAPPETPLAWDAFAYGANVYGDGNFVVVMTSIEGVLRHLAEKDLGCALYDGLALPYRLSGDLQVLLLEHRLGRLAVVRETTQGE
jgi:hypothetical protein